MGKPRRLVTCDGTSTVGSTPSVRWMTELSRREQASSYRYALSSLVAEGWFNENPFAVTKKQQKNQGPTGSTRRLPTGRSYPLSRQENRQYEANGLSHFVPSHLRNI